jgi:hypothetical protein
MWWRFLIPFILLLWAPAYLQDRPAKEGPKPSKQEVVKAIKRGIEFLIKNQNKTGSWGSGITARPAEVTCSPPGSHRAFRNAVTALCCMALNEAIKSGIQEKGIRRAYRAGINYLVHQGHVRRQSAGEVYNDWAYIYGLQALSQAYTCKDLGDLKEGIKRRAEEYLGFLRKYQCIEGGWGYYEFWYGTRRPWWGTSFTTASALISLYHARLARILEVKPTPIRKALKFVKRMRLKNGAYIYGNHERYVHHPTGSNGVNGSLARSQACNLALYLFDEVVTKQDLVKGLENFFKGHKFLNIARKEPRPHYWWYANSGYYFFYGHYYVGLIIELLSDEEQKKFWPRLREKILKIQEKDDGSWFDMICYNYHKFWGTPFALIALIRSLKGF